jgi:hypothetical protein
MLHDGSECGAKGTLPSSLTEEHMANRQTYFKRAGFVLFLLAAFGIWLWIMDGTALGAANPGGQGSSLPWWAWVLILFVMTFAMGIVAVLGGAAVG